MSICIYIFIHTNKNMRKCIHMETYKHVHTRICMNASTKCLPMLIYLQTCIYTDIYTNVQTCIYVHIPHIYSCVPIYTHIPISIYVVPYITSTHKYTNMYLCTQYIYVQIWTHKHTHIYLKMHTYANLY